MSQSQNLENLWNLILNDNELSGTIPESCWSVSALSIDDNKSSTLGILELFNVVIIPSFNLIGTELIGLSYNSNCAIIGANQVNSNPQYPTPKP